jgi:hypothetical protein
LERANIEVEPLRDLIKNLYFNLFSKSDDGAFAGVGRK